MNDLYLPKEAAGYLHTPVTTLQWWRHLSRGPKYVKIGRRIFYRKADLDAFIAAAVHTPIAA